MTGNVVLVTGGGRGIGRAICRRFAADGARVVAASRTAEELAETRRLIESTGGHCDVQRTDVCVPEEIDALVETALQRYGRVDTLVNCAGVAPKNLLEELDPHLFEVIVAVNVTAVYHACRAVWPTMRAQGEGVIINISSVSSADPFAGFAAYGASKAWVNAWTRGLADEGHDYGIRVFAVAPGAVETRTLRDAFPDFPMEKTLQPSDIADTVYALAQPGCRYVTGQTVFVKK